MMRIYSAEIILCYLHISLAFSPSIITYHQCKHLHNGHCENQSNVISTRNSNRFHTCSSVVQNHKSSLALFPIFGGFFNNNDDKDGEKNNQNEISPENKKTNDSSTSTSNVNNGNNNNNRDSEFDVDEQSKDTTRFSSNYQQRLEKEQELHNAFVPYGDELWKLRSTLVHLSKQLIQVIAKERGGSSRSSGGSEGKSRSEIIQSVVREDDLRNMIREVEMKDPEFVYALEKERMESAIEDHRLDDAEEHREKAKNARSVLPQFNLHGLWVGNYGGDKGFEMVNVTYIGDTLIARKVTGDENVPAGEITFQADLSPPKPTQTTFKDSKDEKKPLSNIILSEAASKKWNTKQLARFTGLGQVAERGFVESQWMDGQLVFINQDYFSFGWLPLNHQILFGRPSYDLTIKMLTEAKKIKHGEQLLDEIDEDELCIIPPTLDDDMDVLNEHVSKCFDATLQLVEECSLQDDSSSCIFYDDDPTICCFE